MDEPHGDVRRLAYADWLDERGSPADEARATFIRTQVARARDGSLSPIPLPELKLLDQFERQWRHWLPEAVRDPGFVRYECGFPSMLECDAGLLIDGWARGPILCPIETLTLRVGAPSPSWLQLRRPEPMFPLKYLGVTCDPPVGSQLVAVLRRLGPFPRLTELDLRDAFLSDSAVPDLLPGPMFPELKRLGLAGCNLTDDGAEALAESGWVGRLERLDLTGNPVSPARVAGLRSRFGAALLI
jgi:uncharacterized protein (TIGR02996 family)